jgi:hypothetical protein
MLSHRLLSDGSAVVIPPYRSYVVTDKTWQLLDSDSSFLSLGPLLNQSITTSRKFFLSVTVKWKVTLYIVKDLSGGGKPEHAEERREFAAMVTTVLPSFLSWSLSPCFQPSHQQHRLFSCLLTHRIQPFTNTHFSIKITIRTICPTMFISLSLFNILKHGAQFPALFLHI